jgi:hypothetical protein
MASQGAFGIDLKIMVATTLTTIANVESVTFPKPDKVLAESTGHDSTAGYAEWIASGKRNLDEFSITVVWDSTDSTHAAIVTAFDADAAVSMSIEDPGAVEVISGSAHVKSVERKGDMESSFEADVVFQPTGQWSIA